MNQLKKKKKNAGGLGLIWRYMRMGLLGTAVLEFMLLGRSRTGLELFRKVMDEKICRKLERKFGVELNVIIDKIDTTVKHQQNKTIWILWWQGIENAPQVVKKCYESVKEWLSDWNIVLLDEDNYTKYVTLPDFIMDKFKKGIIPMAQFSDLLRLELLINRGGMWMDSTVFVSGSKLPPPISDKDTDLFVFTRPSEDERIYLSNWLIYARSNCHLLKATRDLLYAYWKRNDWLCDYFIFHKFFTLVCDKMTEESSNIYRMDNALPHILLLHLFDEYDEDFWNDLKKQSSIHKLTYKIQDKNLKIDTSYYKNLIVS